MDKTISCEQFAGRIPDRLWEKCEPLVEDAAKFACYAYTPQTVREAITRGDQQLWCVFRGTELKFIWVTEIMQEASRKMVVVYAAAGEMQYGWEFWPYMSRWMEGNKISEAEVYCRPSMARLLRRKGLKTRFEVLTIPPFGGTE